MAVSHPPPLRLRLSANFNQRPAGQAIDTLIIHYTGMTSAAAALDRLCDPRASVSAHYLIDENGGTWQLVADSCRAWHAGVSFWRGRTDINGCSIGIELAHPGHEFGYRPFPAAQINSLIRLCHSVQARHPIEPSRVLGHADVAPGRKQDPGEAFPWRQLAAAGIGLWPPDDATAGHLRQKDLQAALRRIGYDVPDNGRASAAVERAVAAFQSHFRPWRIDGRADDQTSGRLLWMADRTS
ncbi:MAG: N-acetylmuramoyl-L-alanine amidase [Alphaproteobacteria bacterium]